MAYDKCRLINYRACPLCTIHSGVAYCGQVSGMIKDGPYKGLPANQIKNLEKCPIKRSKDVK